MSQSQTAQRCLSPSDVAALAKQDKELFRLRKDYDSLNASYAECVDRPMMDPKPWLEPEVVATSWLIAFVLGFIVRGK